MGNLTIDFGSIKVLNQNIPPIVRNIINEIIDDFDVIVPMPSSSNLSAILAKRLSRASGRMIFSDVFAKSTNADAMASITKILDQNPRALPKTDAIDVNNAIKRLKSVDREPFFAKTVKTRIRKYFKPIVLNAVPADFHKNTRVLLVDDLLATGETLRAAQDILCQLGIRDQHSAVTWFSKVGK
nr:phosphoribosyltransferase family protein [Brucella anthropi]